MFTRVVTVYKSHDQNKTFNITRNLQSTSSDINKFLIENKNIVIQ